MEQCSGCVHTLRTSKKIHIYIRQAQRVKLVKNIFLYYKISDLKIRFKRREQFKEEDRKEVAIMCGRKESGIIK